MSEATELQRIELEKIVKDLEEKAAALNEANAEAVRLHKVQLDTMTGDARLELLALEKEIADLKAERDNLASTVNLALAEIQAEKLRQAGEAARLRAEAVRIEDAEKRVAAERVANESLLARLAEERKNLDADREKLVFMIHESNSIISRSEAAKAELVQLKVEADRTKAEAEEMASAIRLEADQKLEAARELMAQALEESKKAAEAVKTGLALKAEYDAKLAESTKWVEENSALAAKLQVWEVALRHANAKVQEEKGKLKQAELEFARREKEGK